MVSADDSKNLGRPCNGNVRTAASDPKRDTEACTGGVLLSISFRAIYKSYPPAGPADDFETNVSGLREREPEIVEFDTAKLRTKEDWIRAGKAVFEMPTLLIPNGVRPTTFLGRIVVRQKGQLDLGNFSCANCHTRRMPDGTSIAGAQEFFTREYVLSKLPIRTPPKEAVERARVRNLQFFATPWLDPRPERDVCL
jgi:hypothetical protein